MRYLLSCVILFFSVQALAGGKILATPGVSQIEGAGGGGLVPWAQIAGYATEDQYSVSGFCSRAAVKDFELNVCGAQLNIMDRVEISYAEQTFDVEPFSLELEQDIIGLKVKLYGDLIYSTLPQVTFGIQRKSLQTKEVPLSFGASDTSGNDYYLAASKLHLGAVAGYNLLWNFTLRHSDANEMGLLGFGAEGKSAELLPEASIALLLNKHFAVGLEYRQKPDNLGLDESHWADVFVAWFPNKYLSVTAAYLDLDTIATFEDQTGWYMSLTGYY